MVFTSSFVDVRFSTSLFYLGCCSNSSVVKPTFIQQTLVLPITRVRTSSWFYTTCLSFLPWIVSSRIRLSRLWTTCSSRSTRCKCFLLFNDVSTSFYTLVYMRSERSIPTSVLIINFYWFKLFLFDLDINRNMYGVFQLITCFFNGFFLTF